MRSSNFSKISKLCAALGAAVCLALPALASAQQQPYPQSYPQQQPSYAVPPPSYGHQNGISGTISGFDGQWIVYMHDDKGYTDHITLHQGTIINPTGIKLLEGMNVTVYGYADGPTFQANIVNVASSPYSPYYTPDNGNPAYGYGYGYGSPYGYGYGYPYGYGYGYGYPYFGIGINWGWGWGWGWPGWGWGGCCGYGYGYGGYPYYPGYHYPYYPGRYPYYPGRYYGQRGTVSAPAHGGAPVTGGAHGSAGGGGHPPR
ncbi:MAG TPA: hypothetical protein VFF63_02985 [Candidatus Babeliales bacterium]|nr:hypothetical protein [Candidatus Babeliales bacterium]